VSTINGPVNVTVSRDRNGTFEPRIVPKHGRRLGNLDDMILSLYSRGMTTRDRLDHPAVLALLQTWPPAGLVKAGKARVRSKLLRNARRLGPKLAVRFHRVD
jgi:hypothetical protein